MLVQGPAAPHWYHAADSLLATGEPVAFPFWVCVPIHTRYASLWLMLAMSRFRRSRSAGLLSHLPVIP